MPDREVLPMVIIDRFEGESAVLEFQGKIFSFPRALLPAIAREGDVLKISADVVSVKRLWVRSRPPIFWH